jgi:hypothetical protein
MPVYPGALARQHCPSPLHQHHQLKAIAASKEIIYHRTVIAVQISPIGGWMKRAKGKLRLL